MDAKDSIVVFLLLLLFGVFGSVTYCVWSKQLASELDDLQNKLQSNLQSELRKELKNVLQVALNNRILNPASGNSQVKGQLKRNIR